MKALFPTIDFDAFHQVELPNRLAAGNAALAAAGLRDVAPLAFRLPDKRSYTYVATAGGIEIDAGTDRAATIVELTEEAWTWFVHELRTIHGLFYSEGLSFARGYFEHLDRWEPALRAMLHGRPVYDPYTVDLRDRQGRPLDLHRAFTWDDPEVDLAHFLREAGYLRVKQVFSSEEIDELRAEVERLRADAQPGDRRSWWAVTESGKQTLCRLIYTGQLTETIAALDEDPRVRRLAGLAGAIVRPVPDRMDGHIVVLKIPGAREGMADLPWHIDCGLGGHSILCPSVLVGIQLDAARPETGQLHFLPGSWRRACSQVSDADAAGLPAVAIETEVGDCTVHMGDSLHRAPSQRTGGPGRRTLYIQFYNPAVFGVVEAGCGFNDMILEHDPVVPRATREMLVR